MIYKNDPMQAVRDMILNELAKGIEKHGLHNSPHEAYAVLLEEVEEVNDNLKRINQAMDVLWRSVKRDHRAGAARDMILDFAKETIIELVQVAAMVEKYKISEEEWNNEKEPRKTRKSG